VVVLGGHDGCRGSRSGEPRALGPSGDLGVSVARRRGAGEGVARLGRRREQRKARRGRRVGRGMATTARIERAARCTARAADELATSEELALAPSN
jgi:hypothetical protein